MTTALLPEPATPPQPRARPTWDDTPVVIPPSAWTLAGFRAWYASTEFPEGGRISFLAGEIVVEMGHERLSSHVSLKGELTRALIALALELNVGQFLTDGTRLVSEAADLSNEPDGCYLTWDAVRSGRVVLRRSADGADVTEVVGAPDMVMELVSPSSVAKDTARLPGLYHRAGIPEYWLIDARGEEVRFTILRHTPDGYEPVPAADSWLPSAVFGRRFRLDRVRNPIELWQYTLHVAPLTTPSA